MDKKRAFDKAAALCARQERCISDIEKKLFQWEVPEELISEIINDLIKHNYINEVRFASFYVRDKFRFNHWGKQKIKWQLKQKNLPDDIIKNSLQAIDDDEYIDILNQILKDKKRSIRQPDKYKEKAALIRFAGSRGFEYDLILKSLEQIM